MAKPVWSQMRMTISAKVLMGGVWTQRTGLPPRAVQTALSSPYLRLARRAPRRT